MSRVILVVDNDDMPCNDWEYIDKDEQPCPMKNKWHEGEIRMCHKCGWNIAYNTEAELTND